MSTGVDQAVAGATASVIEWLQAIAPGAALTSDSRSVRQGSVFFAYAGDGTQQDGRRFIEDAIERGACAVIFDAAGFTWDARGNLPHLACKSLRQLAGEIARVHYGSPDNGMFCVAVTGTNGKTSCTQWLAAALSRKAQPALVVGTFGIGLVKHGVARQFAPTGYTTPDALQLQAALANARTHGVAALAIEASSIGLQQQRMRGLHIDVALFTNLTRDHLDYHGDMASYEAAKTALFDWPGLRHAVINLDDAMGLRLVAHLRASAPQVGLTGYTIAGADGTALGPDGVCLEARALRGGHAGTHFDLHGAGAATKTPVRTQLMGDFNVSNVLGVLGVLLAKGMPSAEAIAAIEALQPVAGRMQQLGGPEQPLVVIDYAHTPDALQKTLASLRRVARDRNGALWCVFGCGGDRDPGKRPLMGAISEAADRIIVTSDNPRGEQPGLIIADIVAGIDAVRAPHVIEDRATAILWAVRHAAKSDVILLAGKGHENYQEIKGRKLQFLDADHAALGLAARATMKGPH